MIKRRVKIISVIVAVVTVALSLCAIGYANIVNDGLFNMNTPMRITPNSTVVGTMESREDYFQTKPVWVVHRTQRLQLT